MNVTVTAVFVLYLRRVPGHREKWTNHLILNVLYIYLIGQQLYRDRDRSTLCYEGICPDPRVQAFTSADVCSDRRITAAIDFSCPKISLPSQQVIAANDLRNTLQGATVRSVQKVGFSLKNTSALNKKPL